MSSGEEEIMEDLINSYFALSYGVLYLTGVPLILLRRNYEPIKSRGWVLSVLQVFSAFRLQNKY